MSDFGRKIKKDPKNFGNRVNGLFLLFLMGLMFCDIIKLRLNGSRVERAKPMRNIGGTSKFIAFFDECGDHSLEKVDKDFPLFILAAVIVQRDDYKRIVIPTIADLKLTFWNHEGINLHSRDIRKSVGPFSFLMNSKRRKEFMDRLNGLMGELPYTLFLVGIRKNAHLDKYGPQASNPYELALQFSLERIVHFLEQMGESELPCVVEARGKKEDEQLERVFYRIMTYGTYYRPAEQFKKLSCPLVFRSKRDNIIGIQIADLCAYPCARHVLRPKQPNRAYEIVNDHVYESGTVRGWKIFP